MKIAVYFLLTCLTLGQFGIYWLFEMVFQTYQSNDDSIAIQKKKAVKFGVTYAIYIVGFVFVFYQIFKSGNDLSSAILLLHLGLTALAIYLMVEIYKIISQIANFVRANNVALPSNLGLLLLIACYGAGFILLQRRLNEACKTGV